MIYGTILPIVLGLRAGNWKNSLTTWAMSPNKGVPAIQTTARYTQVSRKDIKTKLRLLGGE